LLKRITGNIEIEASQFRDATSRRLNQYVTVHMPLKFSTAMFHRRSGGGDVPRLWTEMMDEVWEYSIQDEKVES